MVSTLQQMPTIGPLFIHVKVLLEIFCQPLPVLEISSLNLSQDQKLIWLIKCWSIHKLEEFLNWNKVNHPEDCGIFILANCNTVLQPMDIIIQQPLKHAFMIQFNSWTMNSILNQINEGQTIEMDFKISIIKP